MRARSLLNPAFLTALAVLALSAIGMGAGMRAFNVYLRKLPIYPPGGRALGSIPHVTARWQRLGADESIDDPDTLKVLGTENYLTRVYTPKEAPAEGAPLKILQFHAAYYTGMIDTVPHVPDRCYTGAGMSIVGGPWDVAVPLDSRGWLPHPDADPEEVGHVYTVRLENPQSSAFGQRVRLPRELTPERPLRLRVMKFAGPGGRTLYAGYFFAANGGWVSHANEVRTLAFDLRNDYAYYLKLQFGSSTAESPEELAALAGSLLDDLLGEIMRCAPDWTEVEHGRYPEDNPRRGKAMAGRN
ncbi:MAG: hypothetical protein ACKVU4_12445 [Phycisphaerales bacterium]